MEIALANNIELLCLTALACNIQQPLNIGVFKPVKMAWRKCLHVYYEETRYRNVDKRALLMMLKRLADDGEFSKANVISAFEEC